MTHRKGTFHPRLDSGAARLNIYVASICAVTIMFVRSSWLETAAKRPAVREMPKAWSSHVAISFWRVRRVLVKTSEQCFNRTS